MAIATKQHSTGKVTADTARIDRLKEQLRSTPAEVDFERVRIMQEVYEDTAGYQTDHLPGQIHGHAAGAEEDIHRRQPLRGQHGQHRQRHLHLSGMESGLDDRGEYH